MSSKMHRNINVKPIRPESPAECNLKHSKNLVTTDNAALKTTFIEEYVTFFPLTKNTSLVESFPAILVPGMPHTNPSVVFTSPQGVGAIFAGSTDLDRSLCLGSFLKS
jgi:hypothetical protein